MKKLRVVASDPQREALFQLEKEFEGFAVQHSAPRKFLSNLLRKICRYYGVPLPELKYARKRVKEYGWTEFSPNQEFAPTTIVLNEWCSGNNAFTLVHELAHHITDSLFDDAANHGPEFCAIYMHLLNRHRMIPEDCFRLIARRWGLRIASEYLPAALHSA